LIAEDGTAAICARIQEGSEIQVGTSGAGWLHRLTDNPTPVKHRPKPKPFRQVPVPDFLKLQEKYQNELPYDKLLELSDELGLSKSSLNELGVGWASWWGKWHYSFPIRDGSRKLIGIRLRCGDSRVSVKGSKNGLFWPATVKKQSKEILFLPEGYSDTGAMRDMGCEAIGRPNCSAGLEYLIQLLKGQNRQVVIVADKDEAKTRPNGSVYYPGIDGAMGLVKGIKSTVASVRVIKPPLSKDIRQWYNEGCTKSKIMAMVNNSRF